ncbi:endo-1,4-beta-xylanase [Geofilum rubicundum]|uniref:endo-1,4-beta-xylanase n=1 Tax=Geofilum rubicundum JCM 15548 TaxID=1236989 RepID=A0A0E9M0G7_9BACT|nr:endo-1,4-beta-xylanase [Geofilum rubicundum]GAO30861.1 endo-1,4-beta-xylanase A precursor [Geofilum rubicundum JCM 15548]
MPVVALAALMSTGCDDSKMEWEEMDPSQQIEVAEIPLLLSEKISRYEALKSYTDLNLGVGIGLDLYMNREGYDSIVHENFDEVVIGYAMKHAAMVSGSGVIDFSDVDAFIQKAKDNGLTTYGHTLVWHQNQNASYLNSLIAPEIIPGPAGSSVLDVTGLEDGTFSGGWARQNPGDGIELAEGEGLGEGADAIRLVSSASSSAAYNLQLITPEIPAIEGHTYEVSFYIRSDQPGQGRISFGGLANNYPWKDWMATGSATEAFTTTSTWQQVKFTVDDFTGTSFTMAFDLGYLPGVTYYLDINNLVVIDLDAEPTVINMLANGDFEAGIEGWSKWNGPDNALTHATGEAAFQGEGAMRVEHDISDPGSQWKVQIHSDFTSVLPEGDYNLSFYVRSEAAGSIRCSTTGTARYQGDQSTSGTWKLIEWTFTSDGAIEGLNFDLGAVAGVYYIDNVVVSAVEAAGAPKLKATTVTIVEKTDEEKTQIIGDAMESWIGAMMTHYKDDVKAWDVVNEPMNENGTRRDGSVTNPDVTDEFFWVKYLGDDFAVKAFNLARQYGNADDILFINDYNLEHSLAKCDGLIEYVSYIESQGATVDGIGTQMHIGIDTNKDNIVAMFEKLAASGKMIKVTELDVRVNTDAPSEEQFMAQAEMYRFVAEKYLEIIPAAQQYGITIWGVSDHEEEHIYWIPDDAPNLWDADYQRKVAYKGFADGLAGRDVSEDFTGELQY